MNIVAFLNARILEDETRAHHVLWLGTTGAAPLYSPNRVLAECKSKRELIELADAIDDGTWGRQLQAEALLGYLAGVYSDHHDYKKEWAS